MIETRFERVEKKYIINEYQYSELMKLFEKNMKKDKYYFSTICNVYFDTSDFELIRKSIEKPIYKEKVRIRSYGIPTIEDKVFFELKKKYKGIVYKRRINIKLSQLYKYLETKKIPNCERIANCDTQIMKEIDYIVNKYDLKEAMYLAYERYSYCGIEKSDFRITIDKNIRSRTTDLRIESTDEGKLLLDTGLSLMEVKTSGAMPMWFVKELSRLEIYPNSFTKYGNAYIQKNNKLGMAATSQVDDYGDEILEEEII